MWQASTVAFRYDDTLLLLLLLGHITVIASDSDLLLQTRVAWLVCQSVCLHIRDICENSQTDLNTVWEAASGKPKESCIRWV